MGEMGEMGRSCPVFCSYVRSQCQPADASPHHVVLLADPQLVDPHTYPGRPWPLSTMTIRHTDQYLKRSFSKIQKKLGPDTAIFLGDLFDGGREWGHANYTSPEAQYRGYKDSYWLGEYNRLGKIFFNQWNDRTTLKRQSQDRKFIASLPGNHDLGIGTGIRLPVRDRFELFFGNGNRVDIIGNHTIVSVDTVSLSAKSEPDASLQNQDAAIWSQAETFLENAKDLKQQALASELRGREGKSERNLERHVVMDWDEPMATELRKPLPQVSDQMPTVLLTHVPLYREPGVRCGPLRERYPAKLPYSEDSIEKDDRNAISISKGYQYSNVLLPHVSKELIDKIGNVGHVFSGDDHDYCEVVHRGYSSRGGGVREITVKSMSWAMGVRRPGFLLVSLWNPVDEKGDSLNPAGTVTLQTKLCLLPNQLAIFECYLSMVIFTIFVLALRAASVTSRRSKALREERILPLASPDVQSWNSSQANHIPFTLLSSDTSYNNGVAIRTAGRPRSASPATGYAYIAEDTVSPTPNGKSYTPSNFKAASANVSSGRLYPTLLEFRKSFIQLAAFPLSWYLWLAYAG
jgi:hypothetical protein